jgi:hypothetical protein
MHFALYWSDMYFQPFLIIKLFIKTLTPSSIVAVSSLWTDSGQMSLYRVPNVSIQLRRMECLKFDDAQSYVGTINTTTSDE